MLTLDCTAPLSPCKGSLTSLRYDDDDEIMFVVVKVHLSLLTAYVIFYYVCYRVFYRRMKVDEGRLLTMVLRIFNLFFAV